MPTLRMHYKLSFKSIKKEISSTPNAKKIIFFYGKERKNSSINDLLPTIGGSIELENNLVLHDIVLTSDKYSFINMP